MKYRKIILTGGSGKLGKAILSSGCFSGILAPSKHVLDITDKRSIDKFFGDNDIGAVIHCAAIARMAECEKDPAGAIDVNIIGTCNLVMAVMKKERIAKRKIRFIYISTDGVYPGTDGDYKETAAAIPYNRYGWTKLGGECAVNMLSDYCIIRTSFFDPAFIPFDESAVDAYSSKVPIEYLVKALSVMIKNTFVGTINIGGKRLSDYERYKKFKPQLIACRFKDIEKKVPCKMAKDASMDSSIWKKIEKKEKIVLTRYHNTCL